MSTADIKFGGCPFCGRQDCMGIGMNCRPRLPKQPEPAIAPYDEIAGAIGALKQAEALISRRVSRGNLTGEASTRLMFSANNLDALIAQLERTHKRGIDL